MSKITKKNCLILVGIASAIFLTGCSGDIYSLFVNSNGGSTTGAGLLKASKSTGDYDYPKVTSDAKGTNYASSASKYSLYDVSEAGVGPSLPSTSSQSILVIPVELKDYTTVCTETTRKNIFNAFFGATSDTAWESLASYYAKSSYGNLILNGTVSDWYDCGYSTTTLAELTSKNEYYDPTWTVLEGAVSWYKNKYKTDAKEFDSDNDGAIDAVWLVYSAPHYSASKTLTKNAAVQNLLWAYTYSDYSVDSFSTNSIVGYHYSWASYDFMYEGYGTSKLDAHTYIHETGHLLGLDDYYVAKSVDKTKNYAPMAGMDMMDYNIIDHCAFSKFMLGWLHPYVVSGSTTISLAPTSTSGQCILLPTSDGWNGSAFDEYMLLEFYTPTGLNKQDAENAYSGYPKAYTVPGIRLFHVDARMAVETVSGNNVSYAYSDTLVPLSNTQGTVVAHSNSNAYNALDVNDRLIQAIDCTEKRNFDTEYNAAKLGTYSADNTTLFKQGDSFSYASYAHSFPNYYYSSRSTMNNGTVFPYSFSVSACSSTSASVTITKA